MSFTFSDLIEPLAGLTTSTPIIIDLTTTEAFLVRRIADAGDIFIVDTTNDEVEIPTGSLLVPSGTVSMAAGTFSSQILALDANGPRLSNVVTSATVPSVIPNRASTITGIGGVSGEVSLIVASTERLKADGTGIDIIGTLGLTGNLTITDNIINLGDGGGDSKLQFQGCTDFFVAINASPEEIAFGAGSTVNQAATEMGMDINSIKFRHNSNNGSYQEFSTTAPLSGTLSGASNTLAGAIPAGVFVMSVTARVITAITGPAGWDIGDGTTVDRWGNSIAVGLGTTVDITDYVTDGFGQFPTGSDIVITSDGVVFTGGEVRVTVHFWRPNAPTS